MERISRLASAQTVPVAGDIETNMRQHLLLAEAAASEDVSLLVFPELSLTGYELERGPTHAMQVEDDRLAPLIAAAHEHDMTLVVGAPVRTSSGFCIGAFIIAPTGPVQVYTKHHLGAFRAEDHRDGIVPLPEETFFSQGTLNPMIAWQGKKLAVSICKDSAFPSHALAAAEKGATIYLSCQFAIPAHMEFKLSRLEDAARKHGLTVVFSNYGGPTGGLPSAGGSCIIAPDGATLVRLPETGCGLAIASEDEAGWVGKTLLIH